MKIKQFTDSNKRQDSGMLQNASKTDALHVFNRTLANLAKSACYGSEIYKKLCKLRDRFYDVALDYMGYVPEDDFVRKLVRTGRAVNQTYPRSKVSQADSAHNWPISTTANYHLEFFVERLIQQTTPSIEVVS